MWLTNGHWFDVDSAAFRTGDIRVADGRIAEIGDASAGSETLDMEGRWLMPGFIDNHVHITLDTLDGVGQQRVARCPAPAALPFMRHGMHDAF